MSKHEQFPSENNIPIESNDDAVLRMLAGANFGPNAKITLPSGTTLNGSEAQVFTGMYREENPESNEPTDDDDRQMFKMLRGAQFGPHARLILPTGRELNGEEANAGIDAVSEIDEDVSYLDSRYDKWTGDPEIDRARLVARALAQNDRVEKASRRRFGWFGKRA